MTARFHALGLVLALGLAGACAPVSDGVAGPGAGGGGAGPGSDVAGVEVALTSVPAGVTCVRIIATVAGQATTTTAMVTAGQSSATISLGTLPAGMATFQGDAFGVACTAIATAPRLWIADTATATLAPGIVTTVSMTFRRNNPVTASVNFLDNVADVIVGFSSTYALMADGTVKQWGRNGGVDRLTPTTVAGLSGITSVSAGQDFACALRNDGAVLCWGTNTNGVLGTAVAVGTTSATPVQIAGLPGPATQVSAGVAYACAVSGTSVYCWGAGTSGQSGGATDHATPASVTLGSFAMAGPTWMTVGVFTLSASQVAASVNTTCAIDSANHLSCWGLSGSGKFGYTPPGQFTTAPVPIAVSVPNVVAAVDVQIGSDHTCLLRGDGVVACSGSNASGQLGDNTTTSRAAFLLTSPLGIATQIAVGLTHTCALSGDQVRCWGDGSAGQLGDGSGINRLAPTLVPGLASVRAVRAHDAAHTCVTLADLTVRCWGVNSNGQLGDGTRLGRPTPVPVLLQ